MTNCRQPLCPDAAATVLPAVLAALSDPTRLAIVLVLARTGERAWGEFDLEIGKSTFSHHVKVLREAGLLHHRREGTRCWISLRDDMKCGFDELLRLVLELAARDPQVTALAARAAGPVAA